MSSMPQVAKALHKVLGDFAEEAGRTSGFVRRRRKLGGAAFVQSLVFGWLANPKSSLSSLSQMGASVGVIISNQGLDKRFTKEAAVLMRQVLEATVAQVISADPVAIPLLQRFNGIIVQDSSIVTLPNELSEVWRGNGSRTGDGQAALKMQVRLNLTNGALEGPLLEDGRSNDNGSSIQDVPMPPGALRLADLGYFSLDRLQEMDERGDYYVTKLKMQTVLFDDQGDRLDLLAVLRKVGLEGLDLPVKVGVKHRLRARLLAVRVSPSVAAERRRRLRREAKVRGNTPSKLVLALADWTFLVTNSPKDRLSLQEAMVLARARWQIELLFKLWKQHAQIDEWQSTKPWRILCEIYAKLIGVVIQHWVVLVSIWRYPNRSLTKATTTIRSYATMLATAIGHLSRLTTVIQEISTTLAAGCRMNTRKTKPNTYQLLLEAATC